MQDAISVPQLSNQEVYQLLLEGKAILVDVRTPKEVKACSFAVGTILAVPLQDIEDRFLVIPKDTIIITACQVGLRSLHAAAFLMYNGYAEVYNLRYGIIRWAADGFPVCNGHTAE